MFSLVSWIFFGLAAIFSAAVVGVLMTSDTPFEFAMLIGPIVLVAIGVAIRFGGRLLSKNDGAKDDRIITLASWAFFLFGCAVIAMGVVTTFNDSAGLFAIVFGALFVGAGYLIKRLFATPEGMKRVSVAQFSSSYKTDEGGRATKSSSVVLTVDEDADEASVRQTVADWHRSQITARPDWNEKRIVEHGVRAASWPLIGAGMWMICVLGASAFAYFGDEPFVWLPAGGMFLVVCSLLGFWIVQGRRMKKFGASHFVPDTLPIHPGDTLEGVVETSLAPDRNPARGFTVTLESNFRIEESHGHGEDEYTSYRSDKLWRDKKHVRGEVREGVLVVPIFFDVPADGRPTTFGSVNEGVRWRVRVVAEVEGLDYDTVFDVPVVEREIAYSASGRSEVAEVTP